MTDHLIAISILIGVPAIIFSYAYFYADYDYPANPLKWLAQRRKNIENARVRRISNLEHDLGFLPCSSDTCWACEADAIRNRYRSVDSLANECYDKMIESTYVKLWRQ